MKALTSFFNPWDILGIGLGVISLAFIADALAGNHSGALAQSTVVQSVSNTINQLTGSTSRPDANSLSRLLHVGNRTLQVTFDNSVSTEPTGALGIEKIAFGRVSHVNIVTTSSGVYSSDGLASPHVLYPGVSVVSLPSTLQPDGIQLLVNGQFIDLQKAGNASVDVLDR